MYKWSLEYVSVLKVHSLSLVVVNIHKLVRSCDTSIANRDLSRSLGRQRPSYVVHHACLPMLRC